MTPEELAAIKERANKASRGPWYKREVKIDHYLTHSVCLDTAPKDKIPNHQVLLRARNICIHLSGNDADFIAHARTDVPTLVAEVEQLRLQLESCENARISLQHRAAELTCERDRLYRR